MTILHHPQSDHEVQPVDGANEFDRAARPADPPTLAAPWPELPPEALYGVAGEITKHACERSEADPAAVLLTFLTWASASFGSQSYYLVGNTKHYPRLYVVCVGQSSRARKGTSVDPVRAIFDRISVGDGACAVSPGPLSTGEGIVCAVRDPSEKLDEAGNPIDAGVADKRLLVIEGELGAPLRAAQREGNTLSAILRSAWDHGDVAPLTKRDRIKATGAHISIVGHITRPELQDLLQKSDIWNGFANRFLWAAVRRSKRMPFPIPMDATFIESKAISLKFSISHARQSQQITMTEGAKKLWEGIYETLTEDRIGIVGAVTDRAEAQVIRLALIFALLDRESQIDEHHLQAACAVWQFCDESAQYIFGAHDPVKEAILSALSKGPTTRTELIRVFHGHVSAEKLDQVLDTLLASKQLICERSGGGPSKGKPVTTYRLVNSAPLDTPENLANLSK